jgi:hypothetical protein
MLFCSAHRAVFWYAAAVVMLLVQQITEQRQVLNTWCLIEVVETITNVCAAEGKSYRVRDRAEICRTARSLLCHRLTVSDTTAVLLRSVDGRVNAWSQQSDPFKCFNC